MQLPPSASHHREEWPAHTTHLLEMSDGYGVASAIGDPR
jgi:hypothetical protein